MLGKLRNLTVNPDGTQDITVTIHEDFRRSYDELSEKEVTIEIKKVTRSRSLDANALAWRIIDKIAAATGVKKSEVYRHAVRDIGGVSTVICVVSAAADTLKHNWESKGMGWQAELFESKLEGCTNVTLYYGSSVYDTKQMSALIDSLIQDAEALGLTVTDAQEKERALKLWDTKKQKELNKAA